MPPITYMCDSSLGASPTLLLHLTITIAVLIITSTTLFVLQPVCYVVVVTSFVRKFDKFLLQVFTINSVFLSFRACTSAQHSECLSQNSTVLYKCKIIITIQFSKQYYALDKAKSILQYKGLDDLSPDSGRRA